MPDLAEQLMESAAAVAALGSEGVHFGMLDDASVTAGMTLVRDHRRHLQAYELLLSAEIARRSSHEFGNDGLARRNGSATPAVFIQSLTGSSIDEATKLAGLGAMVADAAAAEAAPLAPEDSCVSPLVGAAVSGDISIAAADAIRKGLGRPDAAITAEQLGLAEIEFLAQAGSVSPESLLKLARMARNDLDLDAIERGQKERHELRYLRTWQHDGMSGGSWRLPNEDGGTEIHTALKLLLASRTGGPRFPETDSDGNAKVKSAAQVALEDPRTFEQVAVDGFAQIFLNGLHADPSVVPGARRAPVRVMVSENTLDARRGSALLEGSLTAVTYSKLEEHLCEGGSVGILFDSHGDLIDVGREQRLFTRRQRIGLGARDGGCRYPGCDKPPSWCEAHHILEWAKDRGKTDIANGVLLCRYHHMFIHDSGSRIVRETGADGRSEYWLKPSKRIDPAQSLIDMPSNNPLVTTMMHAS